MGTEITPHNRTCGLKGGGHIAKEGYKVSIHPPTSSQPVMPPGGTMIEKGVRKSVPFRWVR